jgi:hypothetical protein
MITWDDAPPKESSIAWDQEPQTPKSQITWDAPDPAAKPAPTFSLPKELTPTASIAPHPLEAAHAAWLHEAPMADSRATGVANPAKRTMTDIVNFRDTTEQARRDIAIKDQPQSYTEEFGKPRVYEDPQAYYDRITQAAAQVPFERVLDHLHQKDQAAQVQAKMAQAANDPTTGRFENFMQGGAEGVAKLRNEVGALVGAEPMRIPDKSNAEYGGYRSFGQFAGGAVPLLVAPELAPERLAGVVGAGLMTGSGVGSAINEGREKGWTPGQTATIAAERGTMNALMSKFLPGSQGVKAGESALMSGAKTAAGLYSYGVAQAGLEAKLMNTLGLKSENELAAMVQAAGNGSNIAQSLLFGGIHAIHVGLNNAEAAKASQTPVEPAAPPTAQPSSEAPKAPQTPAAQAVTPVEQRTKPMPERAASDTSATPPAPAGVKESDMQRYMAKEAADHANVQPPLTDQQLRGVVEGELARDPNFYAKQEKADASPRNPTQEWTVDGGENVARTGEQVAGGVPPVVEPQRAQAGNKPRDVAVAGKSGESVPSERGAGPALNAKGAGTPAAEPTIPPPETGRMGSQNPEPPTFIPDTATVAEKPTPAETPSAVDAFATKPKTVSGQTPNTPAPSAPLAKPETPETNKPTQAVGAAHPESPEFEAPEFTGVKHATVAKERTRLGLPERNKLATVHDNDVIDAAVQRHLADSTHGERLLSTLEKRPRTLEIEEIADLLVHQRSMLNERTRLEDEIVKAEGSNDGTVEALRDQLAATNKSLETNFRVTEFGGTRQGLAFRARRWMMGEGYTLGEMERSYRAAKGEELTPAEQANIKSYAEKIESAEKQLKAIQDRITEETRKRLEAEQTRIIREKEEREAYRAMRDKKAENIPERRANLVNGLKDAGDNADSWIREIYKTYVAEGVRNNDAQTPELRDRYLDATLKDVQTILPDFTRSQVSDAITGYGDFKLLSKEDAEVRFRQYRGELRELAKMEDVVNLRRAPKKTGMERQAPSDVERNISKLLRERMKSLGINIADPETQLKTALQSRKTYYENRIKDLKLEIAKRERTVKGDSPQPTDKELEALKAEYATVKQEHEDVFGRKVQTDEERIKIALKAAERADAENQRRIREMDLFPNEKRRLTSPELEAARARAKASAEDVKLLRELDESWTAARENAKMDTKANLLEQQIAELERQLNSGTPDPAKPSVKTVNREDVQKLQDRRNELTKLRNALRKPVRTPEEIALQSRKAYMLNRLASLSEKVVTGDYAPVGPREGVKLNQELLRIQGEINKWKNIADRGKERYRLAHRTTGEKVWDTAVDILGAHKGVFLAGDVSYVLNQGGRLLGAAPVKMLTSLKDLFRAGFSEKYANAMNAAIENGPKAAEYKTAGLNFISDRHPSEQFVGRVGSNLPVMKQMERGQRAYINRMMAHVYDKLTTPDMTPAEKKAQANFVNDLVQRTTFGKRDHLANAASVALISPRSMASHIKMAVVNPAKIVAPWRVEGMTQRVRLQQAKVYAGYVSAIAGIYAIGAALGADIEDDPRSGAFGKMRWGNKTLDPLSGLSSYLALMAQLGTGESKTTRGDIVPNRGPDVKFGMETGTDKIVRFLGGRKTPLLSLAADFFTGKNYDRDPLTIETVAKDYGIPLGIQNIIDINKEDGIPSNLALSVLSFLGERVNTYKDSVTPDQKRQFLQDIGMDKPENVTEKTWGSFKKYEIGKVKSAHIATARQSGNLSNLSPEEKARAVYKDDAAHTVLTGDYDRMVLALEKMTPTERKSDARLISIKIGKANAYGKSFNNYWAVAAERLNNALKESKDAVEVRRLNALLKRLDAIKP